MLILSSEELLLSTRFSPFTVGLLFYVMQEDWDSNMGETLK